MPPKKKITRRAGVADEPRDSRITARITKSQREEISDISRKIRVDDSAFVRMAVRKVSEEYEKGDLDVDKFIDEYGSTT